MACATAALCTLLAAASGAALAPGPGPGPSSSPAGGSRPARAPEVRRVELPGLIEQARHGPGVELARASAREAQARAAEINRAWLPSVELVFAAGPSPRITCLDQFGNESPERCLTTDPSENRIGFAGIFFHLEGTLLMPLFTFGKVSAGRRAAEAGAKAADALASQAEHDAVVDAARAYFAVKLGRELQVMLDDGMGYVDKELEREQGLLEQGSGEVTEADHRRVLTLRAEIQARRSEARKVEELGLAGVRYLWGAGDVDVDERPLQPLDFELPDMQEARSRATARAEQRAAVAGEEAAASLLAYEWAGWWPDFVLVGSGRLARSSSVPHPSNAFMTDPYNATSAAIGVALRWKPDLFTRLPRIDQAEARLAKARAAVELARTGLPADAERAWAEARDARDRIRAAREGVKQSRAWLASVLQSEAAGLVEPKDMADALLEHFVQRGRLIQATFEWNVGVVALLRATGRMPGALRYAEGED